jgi:hypothetical protein
MTTCSHRVKGSTGWHIDVTGRATVFFSFSHRDIDNDSCCTVLFRVNDYMVNNRFVSRIIDSVNAVRKAVYIDVRREHTFRFGESG